MATPSGPKFIRFFWPLVEALRELGGSAQARDAVDLVVEMLDIPDEERAERTKSGSLRIHNQVHWARNYLVWAGFLNGSKTRLVAVERCRLVSAARGPRPSSRL